MSGSQSLLSLLSTLLGIASLGICLVVIAGRGFGEGKEGIRLAFLTALGMGVASVALSLIAGTIPFPLILAAILAGAYVRYTNETGASKTARTVAKVLLVISVVAGLFVVGAGILFMLALNSWANSK